PDCGSGAIFCLLYAPQTLSFQLNIDAVSRSAVRIDPRVLRLSKGGY
ncbi:MAG: YfiR/HmsC family protein, partial [Sphingobium limneticum]